MSALSKLNLTNCEIRTGSISTEQGQTRDAFAFKWSKRETYESESVKSNARQWLLERYCESDPERVKEWLSKGPQIILDAGCGSGFSSLLLFGQLLTKHHYLGVDISSAVDIARVRFQESGIPAEFLQRSFLDLPIPRESVDLIFAEGVLHHTDNTELAIKDLSSKLRMGGHFLFYVYAKKAAIREYTDDYIREQLRSMSDEDAWVALKSLTKLGVELGNKNVELDITEDIPLLGIQRGKIDLQRFFYWNICKAYYRPEYSLEEMNHVNFDWFRPLNCHRHTPEEIRTWCQDSGLYIERMDVQEAGITVVAVKRSE